MRKIDKKRWIMNYIRENTKIFADVCSEEFVQAYIEQCSPKRVIDKGAFVPYVPELGRYLSELYNEGYLSRYAHGLNYSNDGYPKWVYVYTIRNGAENGKDTEN